MPAPNLQKLEKKVLRGDSVKLIGCGGCGINLLSDVVAAHPDMVEMAKALDTSRSNINNLDTKNLDEVFELISELEGSGKLRSENADEVVTHVSSIRDFADFNIVMFSLSGGSGSVIGPLIVNEIFRAGKTAIVVCVSDTTSNIDARNTMGTLKTLENISSKNDAYVPMVVLDNKKGRITVNSTATRVIEIITTILLKDAREMDKQDKINFFRPHVLIPAINPGLRLLNVSDNNGDWISDCIVQEDHKEMLDGILLIAQSEDYPKFKVKSHVLYVGFDPAIEDTLIMSVGYRLPDEFIRSINDTIREFDLAAPRQDDAQIESELSDLKVTKSGLVL